MNNILTHELVETGSPKILYEPRALLSSYILLDIMYSVYCSSGMNSLNMAHRRKFDARIVTL